LLSEIHERSKMRQDEYMIRHSLHRAPLPPARPVPSRLGELRRCRPSAPLSVRSTGTTAIEEQHQSRRERKFRASPACAASGIPTCTARRCERYTVWRRRVKAPHRFKLHSLSFILCFGAPLIHLPFGTKEQTTEAPNWPLACHLYLPIARGEERDLNTE
jgi:hypothetical protein